MINSIGGQGEILDDKSDAKEKNEVANKNEDKDRIQWLT
jgi:hypothetical protein